MKFVLLLLIASFGFTAQAKTRLAVSKFSDKSGHSRCKTSFFGNNLGSGMTDQLISELKNESKFVILERENLKNMYSEEHELINADSRTRPVKNKFKAAHYSIVGAITSFELCSSDVGGSVDVGGLLGMKKSGLNIGGGQQSAKVALDLRVVDVTTGEVLTSFTSEGSASSTKVDIKGNVQGAKFGSGAFFSTPLGEATREALKKATERLAQEIPEKADDVVAAAPRPNNVGQAARMPTSSGRSVAQATQISSSHYCLHNKYSSGTTYQMCKVLNLSGNGSAKVLNLATGTQSLTKLSDIYTTDTSTSVKPGEKVIVPCTQFSSFAVTSCYAQRREKRAVECTVVDKVDDLVSVMCETKDFSVKRSAIFLPKKYGGDKQPASIK